MAITLVASGFKENTGNGPATLTVLDSALTVQSGDLVVFWGKQRRTSAGEGGGAFGADGSGSAAIGSVSQVFKSFSGTANRVQMMCSWAAITVGGTLLPTFNDGYNGGVFQATVWRGVDLGSPIVTSAVNRSDGSSATTLTGSAVTPSAAGDVATAMAAVYGGPDIVGGMHTPTSGWAEITDTAGFANAHVVEWVTATDTSPLTSAPVASSGDFYVNGSIVLRAAPEVVPGTVISRGSFF